jgi:hypothetical protein
MISPAAREVRRVIPVHGIGVLWIALLEVFEIGGQYT